MEIRSIEEIRKAEQLSNQLGLYDPKQAGSWLSFGNALRWVLKEYEREELDGTCECDICKKIKKSRPDLFE